MSVNAPFPGKAKYAAVYRALERAIYPGGPSEMVDPLADPVVIRATRAVFTALGVSE